MMDDVSLSIESLREGDRAAWAHLYDWLAADLRSFIGRSGAGDVDDILGETMLQLVRDLPSFNDDVSALRPWAFRIARNRVIDAGRRRSRRPVETNLDEGDAVAVGVAHDGVVDLDVLRRALALLTREQQEALWLRFALDMSVTETARIMDSTPDAVTALTMRALKRLRSDADLG